MNEAPSYNPFSARFWVGPLDLRPLGFMRIAFGLVLFWSTIDLAPVLFDFFSDAGVAPRWALLGMVRANRFSVYDLAGSPWVLVALYALTLLAVLAFTIGWRSRLATIASFVLVTGIHERATEVFDGSDNVIRVLLFWMMFMPAGARYSIDVALRRARGEPQRTHGTAFPIRLGQLQIAWVYLNTTLHKWPGVEWHDGTALRIALGLNHLFVRALGRAMYGQEWFVRLGTHATLAIELSFLPLVFLPLWRPTRGRLSRWPRWLFQPTYKALAIAGGTALHLGIAVLMSVGNFSYVMIASYFLLYEPEWIEAIVTRVGAAYRRLSAAVPGLALQAPIQVGGGGAASSGWPALFRVAQGVAIFTALPAVGATAKRRAGPQDRRPLLPPSLTRAAQRSLQAALAVLMIGCLWSSLPDVVKVPSFTVLGRETPVLDVSPSKMYSPLFATIQELELWQKWDMFSPKPLDHDAYLMGRGVLKDGTEVDVLRGDRGDGTGALLPPVDRGFFFTRWTKYENNILYEQDNSPWTLELGRFLCRKWNLQAPRGRSPLNTFELLREEHRIPLFREKEDGWEEEVIWSHHCF